RERGAAGLIVSHQAGAGRGEIVRITVVVVRYHLVKTFDVGAPPLELADLSTRNRFRRRGHAEPASQPVGGKNFASVRQLRKFQGLRRGAQEAPDHAELRGKWQIEGSAERDLMPPVQTA